MTITNNSIINDFSIQVATVNGSGSQTSNNVLMYSIFQMGVPVGGKNIFPSNIAGLPTWFTIRVNSNGYVSRKKEIDIVVAMNPETVLQDIEGVNPGGVAIYNTDLKVQENRDDIHFYPIPFGDLVKSCVANAKLRKLVTNMIYVGVIAELLGIEYEEVEKALRKNFKTKPKAVELNMQAVQSGIEYTRQHIVKKDPFKIERSDQTAGKIIIDGNNAAALGTMFAGCTVVSWYPITPSSSLCEAITDQYGKYRTDKKTGKATYAIVQAEDEIAAVGMVFGAGWAGARAMTATSGPGISLMTEFAGAGYYAEIPAVIFDIQRLGPSTGLPTRTSQGDILQVAFLSHGDTKHIMLFPGSVEECYTMAYEAFDLAEYLQTPIFVMSDLDLGMNNWMADPFPYMDKPLNRGKVLKEQELKEIYRAGKHFRRYADVDGDGIPYRTLPGVRHPAGAYLTRGSGHNEEARYTESGDTYVRNMDRLSKKYRTAKQYIPKPQIQIAENAAVGIIAFGSSHFPVLECLDQLASKDITASYLRIRAYPFDDAIADFVRQHQRIYVVEQNHDAQMKQLLLIDVQDHGQKLRSVLHCNGYPIDAQFITDDILRQEQKK